MTQLISAGCSIMGIYRLIKKIVPNLNLQEGNKLEITLKKLDNESSIVSE